VGRPGREPHRRPAPASGELDPDKDISIYINSPVGSIYAGLAIYDTMNFIKPDVQTICCGIAMSMGSLLLAGGAPGKRFSLPNSRILIHQPSAGFEGQSSDIEIHMNEILKTREDRRDLRQAHRPAARARPRDMERDRFFKPDEAAEYGLIDKVISPTEALRVSPQGEHPQGPGPQGRAFAMPASRQT
jgi:ATP-dependent Clp protease protease subunit